MSVQKLGDRIKSMYEGRSAAYLPRRSYTIIRIDGKNFSNYTRWLTKPFDVDLAADMDAVTETLCSEVMGCRMAYTQSDEISLVLTDFEQANSDSWFDGNLQKTVSVAASIATAVFNRARLLRVPSCSPAYFDARALSISDREEVINYLVWRQTDAVRNAVSSIARVALSHKEMDGVGLGDLRAILLERGVDVETFPQGFLNGRVVIKERYSATTTNPMTGDHCEANRARWAAMPAKLFVENSLPLDWIPARPPFSRNSN